MQTAHTKEAPSWSRTTSIHNLVPTRDWLIHFLTNVRLPLPRPWMCLTAIIRRSNMNTRLQLEARHPGQLRKICCYSLSSFEWAARGDQQWLGRWRGPVKTADACNCPSQRSEEVASAAERRVRLSDYDAYDSLIVDLSSWDDN